MATIVSLKSMTSKWVKWLFGLAIIMVLGSTTVNAAAPPPPTGLSAISSGNAITLSWINPVSGDFDSISIRQSSIGYPETATAGIARLDGSTETNHTISDLSTGRYYFSIFAKGITGNASTAATISVRIAPSKPILTVTKLDTNSPTVNMSWTVPTGSTLFRYKHITSVSTALPASTLFAFTYSTVSENIGVSNVIATINNSITNFHLNDGTNRIEIVALDEDFNKSPTAVVTIVIDTIAPSSSILYVNKIESSTSTVNVSWTKHPSSNSLFLTKTLNFGPEEMVSSNLIATPNTMALKLLSDGYYEFKLYGLDAYRNTSNASVFSVVIDTIPPDAPVLSVTKLDTNSPTVNISWTIPTGASSFNYDQIYNSVSINRTSNLPTSNHEYSNINFKDGDYTIQVSALDLYSNKSVTASVSFVIDTVAIPPVLMVNKRTTPNTSVDVIWIASPSTDRMILTKSINSGSEIVVSDNLRTSPNFMVLNDLSDGYYQFKLYAVDNYRNTANCSVLLSMDNTPPDSPSMNSSKPFPNASEIDLSWNTPSTTRQFMLKRSYNGGALEIVSSNISASTNSLTQSHLLDGDYAYYIYALDAYFNTSLAGKSPTQTIDTVGPSIPTISATKLISNGTTVNVSWSNPATTFDFNYRKILAGVSTGLDHIIVSGNTFNELGLSDGLYTFQIVALDSFGNKSPTAEVTVNIDTTPPAIPGIYVSTYELTSVVSWYAVPTDAVSLRLERLDPGHSTIIISANIPINSSRVTVNNPTAGNYKYYLSAIDAYGNISHPSTWNLFIALTPPILTIERVSPNSATVNILWTVPTGTTTFEYRHITPKSISLPSLIFTVTTTTVSENIGFIYFMPPSTHGFSSVRLQPGLHTIQIGALDPYLDPISLTIVTFNLTITPPRAPSLYIVSYLPMTKMQSLIRWVTPTDAVSLRLEMSRNGGAPTVVSSNIPLSASRITKNYELEGTYVYYLYSVDEFGNSSQASTFNVVIDKTSPETPTINIEKPVINGRQINVSWIVPSDASYSVLKRRVDNGDFVTVNGNIEPANTTWSETLLPEGNYQYFLKTYDYLSNPSMTSTSSVISIDFTPPTASVITVTKLSEFSPTATISWTVPTGSTEFSYRHIQPAGSVFGLDRLPTYNNEFKNVRLTPGVHRFEIVALDQNLNRAPTASTTVTISGLIKPLLYIAQYEHPKSSIDAKFGVASGTTALKLVKWFNHGDMDVVSDNIDVSTRQIHIDNLPDGFYTFGLYAKDDIGTISEVSTFDVFVDATPPSAPDVLIDKSSTDYNDIVLKWSRPDTTQIFMIKRSFNGGVAVTLDANVPTTTLNLEQIDLPIGDYRYYIYASDAYSNWSLATTSLVSIAFKSDLDLFLERGGILSSGELAVDRDINSEILNQLVGNSGLSATLNIEGHYITNGSTFGDGSGSVGGIVLSKTTSHWTELSTAQAGLGSGTGIIIQNDGRVEVLGKLCLGNTGSGSGYYKLSGGLFTAATLWMESSGRGTFNWSGGTVQVNTVIGHLMNAKGTLQVDSTNGTRVSGNYTQLSDASVTFVLNRSNRGLAHKNEDISLLTPLLDVSGTLSLSGTVSLELGDYSAVMGDQIQLFKRPNIIVNNKIGLASIDGLSLSLPDLGERLSWDTSLLDSKGIIQVVGSGKKRLGGRPLNFPNPFKFTEGTHIGYWLDKESDIEIRMYTAAGSEVFRKLYQAGIEEGGNSGYNKVPISINEVGTDLPSGIYPYLLIFEGDIIGRGKMVVRPH